MPHLYLKEIKKIYAANADATIAKGAKAYLLDQFELHLLSVFQELSQSDISQWMF
jgi:hypothetical protein